MGGGLTAMAVLDYQGVDLIGVPMDLGANIRGTNMGPAALRTAGLHEKIKGLGYRIIDHGDVQVPMRETIAPEGAQQNYLGVIRDVCATVRDRCYGSLEKGRIPVMLGGDHSAAIGSISGVSHWMRKKKKLRPGCIWVDAHADLNTPQSTTSGNIHGMPLSVVLGSGYSSLLALCGNEACLLPEHTALIGVRSVDSCEGRLCKASGIRYYSMRDIDERGMASVIQEALAWAGQGTGGIHLSFDLDAIDPVHAPGVSTPEPGGLSWREAHLLLERIADSRKLSSMDFVELNPMTDQGNQSSLLMVALIQSALGKSIL